MLSLSSLVSFMPMGLALVILGVAVVTAVIDSRGRRRPRQPTGEAVVESCSQSRAA
jgi:hypothetical protein